MKTPYTLKAPCSNCPFRSDVKFFLSPERAQEIKDTTVEDSNFYCHKTITYRDDLDGQEGSDITGKSRVCAGHLITMEKGGNANQPTRIAERLGLYDRNLLEMDSPTYDSMDEWVKSMAATAKAIVAGPESSESEGTEHCGVDGPRCAELDD